MKQITYPALLVIALVLSACDSSTSDKTSHVKYLKPGAAIDFNHSFKGPLDIGEEQTVDLSFRVPHSSGQLKIKLRADSGLSTEPAAAEHLFNLEDGQDFTLQQTLSAAVAGKYYLSIFAEVMDPQGQVKSRVFAIAVQVGDQPDKGDNKKPMIESSSGDRLIIMPVQETHIDVGGVSTQ